MASIRRLLRPSWRAYRRNRILFPKASRNSSAISLSAIIKSTARNCLNCAISQFASSKCTPGTPRCPRVFPISSRACRQTLESHMQKEEQVLFPLMLAGGNPMIVHPIAMMRHEHDECGEELRAIAALTGDMTVPDDACNSWRALYAGLAKLAEDLTEHIHIENNILFPRFEA